MTLVKILLIACFVGLFVWAFRNRAKVGLRAGLRVGAVLLTAAAIISILNPNILQALARFVGVARGTDLLLYVTVVLFVATTIGNYFRFREIERRLAETVRSDALRDVILTQGLPGTGRGRASAGPQAPTP